MKMVNGINDRCKLEENKVTGVFRIFAITSAIVYRKADIRNNYCVVLHSK